MSTAEKYIRIEEIEPAPKTKRWQVRNVRSNEICGVVKWYGGFRAYVFYPTAEFLFDASCMQAIVDHLSQVNTTRKEAK